MTQNQTEILEWDAIDVVCLCHAGMAQDSPEDPRFYLNQILNLTFGYSLLKGEEVEEYLAEKSILAQVQRSRLLND